jgi:hypothetical protein
MEIIINIDLLSIDLSEEKKKRGGGGSLFVFILILPLQTIKHLRQKRASFYLYLVKSQAWIWKKSQDHFSAYLIIQTELTRRTGKVRQGARRELVETSDRRSNAAWAFTDKWGDRIIEG